MRMQAPEHPPICFEDAKRVIAYWHHRYETEPEPRWSNDPRIASGNHKGQALRFLEQAIEHEERLHAVAYEALHLTGKTWQVIRFRDDDSTDEQRLDSESTLDLPGFSLVRQIIQQAIVLGKWNRFNPQR